MAEVSRNIIPGVEVFDDFLSAPDFRKAGESANQQQFYEPDESNKLAIWSTNSGYNPKSSASILMPLSELHHDMLIAAGLGGSLFPTNTAIDVALIKLRDKVLDQAMFGTPHLEWAGIVTSVFRYGDNSRLPWHRDEQNYSGAFVLYLHKTWREDEGGDLLVEDDKSREGGQFIRPIPNRLVLIQAGVRHAVSTICNSSVDRLTISGFLVRTEKVGLLIEQFVAASGKQNAGLAFVH